VTDAEGDPWAPNWPVFGVDWHDAQAHARWRTERDGRPTRLPTEVEWEKAARGVDGRSFPWGDDFEPTFTRMRDSLSGRPYPADVGSFPADRSVYGVLDLAGNCRCWCGEEMVGAVTTMRAARGGSWYVAPARCRSASRTTAEPSLADATLGVRLVRDLPRR
jgi:serine/threonine-protein kinase